MRSFFVLATFVVFFAQSAHAQTLRVLTYNIFGLPPTIGKAGKERWRYPAIAEKVAEFDIVVIQEAWDKGTRALIEDSNFPYHAHGPKPHKLMGANGLITLSKFPIKEVKFLEFEDCVGFDCFAKKGALLTRVELPSGQEIVVINTHLNAWSKDLSGDPGQRTRLKQIQQLLFWIWDRAPFDPVLLMGDLNAGQDTPEYNWLVGMGAFSDLYRNHVQSSGAQGDDLHGFTYVPKENTWIKGITSLVGKQRLDYVLWAGKGRGARVHRAERAFRHTVAQGQEAVHLSDHYGIAVDLTL
jgi:endonuclease/exonuclease/phosphatase family metal-dependent hydrolase